MPTASCTQPTNAVFDGCRYNFLPWENKKPCIAVESFWEDISFRIDTINMLLGMSEMMVCKFATTIIQKYLILGVIVYMYQKWQLNGPFEVVASSSAP